MVNIRGYIASNFTKSFLTIFLPFFMIISLVYLVKISALTSKIQITLLELVQLYSYSIPDIAFYTLPLSFVVALANTLMKLSTDNELIALYALGLKASKIIKGLLLIGVLFSVLLASISFLGMPLSKQYYKSFKKTKKSEAKLNIVPGKLGQKFGEYYVYVKEKKNDDFHDIVIYNRTNQNEEQFFAATEGKLNKKDGSTSLLLTDGYGYTYTDIKLQQAKYKTLEVFETTKKENFQFQDIIAYWVQAKTDEKIMRRALFYLFISLIPMVSVYLVASFTMINPRYQSDRSFLVMFAFTFSFYLIASLMQRFGNLPLLALTVITLLVLGYWLFKQRIARYF